MSVIFEQTSLGGMNHDSHTEGWFSVWLQRYTIDSLLVCPPCGLSVFSTEDSDLRMLSCLLSWWLCCCISEGLSDPVEADYWTQFVIGSVRCSEMISQVHPTSRRTTVSSLLRELKGALEALSILKTLWTLGSNAGCSQPGQRLSYWNI